MSEQELVPDELETARDAFDRNAWREAFESLRKADAEGDLPPEWLEKLAQAAWWNGRLDDCIAARERAFTGHLSRGEPRPAAIVALRISHDYESKLSKAQETAWFKQAQRLLADEPDCVERGYLARREGAEAAKGGDLDEALAQTERALELGTRYGDRDLMALAIHDQGRLLITKGDVEEGLSLLDEAALAAMHGEIGPYPTAVVYCNVIEACRNLADYRRAGEWTEAAKRWCERQAIAGFPGQCRVDRAEVMKLRGAWADAEQEARNASEELKDFRLSVAARAFYEVGEIRLRVGDLAGAAEAFAQASELGLDPQPGLALLKLGEGNVQRAVASISRAVEDESWNRLARARLLPAQVEIALAAGDGRIAQEAAAEMKRIADAFGSDGLRAHACFARAAVQLAQGDTGGALQGARESWQLWQEIDAPYEAAKARALLGEAYRAQGDDDAARPQLQAARSAFEQLGATPDARRVAALLGGGGAQDAAVVTKAFVFTDIVSSTNLIDAIGDEAWSDLVAWHDQTLRAHFAGHRGEEVDHAGDGFFVAFPGASAAIECALAIQRSLLEHRRTHGFAPQVRIGVHAASAARAGTAYRGKGVHETARIAALAEGGEILTTVGTIAELGDGYRVSEPRAVTLKGIAEPVEVVSAEWR